MSSTELHTGKIKRYPRNEGESLTAYAKRFFDEYKWEYTNELLESIEQQHNGKLVSNNNHLSNRINYSENETVKALYLIQTQSIYIFIEHTDHGEEFDVNYGIVNSDGVMNFVSMFYNGGTYLDEQIEELIIKHNL